jgi:hypothetical protein
MPMSAQVSPKTGMSPNSGILKTLVCLLDLETLSPWNAFRIGKLAPKKEFPRERISAFIISNL